MELHDPQWESRLAEALLRDRRWLRRRLGDLRRSARRGTLVEAAWNSWVEDWKRSASRRAARVNQTPPVGGDPALPIVQHRDRIAAAIQAHPVVVICGETGSGKSTQVPRICLELGRGVDGLIGHTQPRRIAARSIAARLAEEWGGDWGPRVAYKTRFADTAGADTRVKLMTDGILLAEVQHDHWLEQYDTLILDEAHERSLNIDLLIGLLARLSARRPDLKLVVMSATIDAPRFAEHFARHWTPPVPGPLHVPVIEVAGRGYPVEIRYRPPAEESAGGDIAGDVDWNSAIAAALSELDTLDGGDTLVFLPTERDIHEAMRSLKGCPAIRDHAAELLPLYASLPSAEQQRIFQAHEGRRIVLATNVAESSLTVPGIRCVIDTGLARVSRYVSRGKVQRLPIEAVSQASADQRAGRCGRLGPGVCIRLYSEQDYLARDRYTTPEIRRASLAGPLLRCQSLGIGGLETLPLLDPPHRDLVRDGYRTLDELGALDGRGGLTDVGRALARLPVDPRIGRMILAARDEGCLREVLVIAAALEIQDPRDRPAGEREAAEQAHSRFRDSRSDFIGLLKLWRFYQQLKEEHGRSALRRACREARLSHARLREWSDVHKQLLKLVRWEGESNVELARGTATPTTVPMAQRELSTRAPDGAAQVAADSSARDSARDSADVSARDSADISAHVSVAVSARVSADVAARDSADFAADSSVGDSSDMALDAGAMAFDRRRYAALHRAILTGLLSGIAYRSESGDYVAAGGVKARLWPGAGPAAGGGARQPAWVVAVEIVETTRRYARTVAAIDPRWVEELAEHLVKRSYGEAQWWRPAGAALVTERKTLFGLTISRRRVPLGPIDPVTAREMFLTEGLVGGDIDLHTAFYRHNQQLAADLARQAAKARRSDLAVDRRRLFDFYHQRLPADVWDVASLHRWRRRVERDRPRILWMSREDLVGEAAAEVDESGFPDWFEVNELRLPLRYRFEPGQADDGVTLVIPWEALGQVTAARVDWCVPALIPEKIERLIRSLPKSTRRILPPTELAVARVASRLRYGEGSFLLSVADLLGDLAGRAIDPAEFQLEKLPHYLTMHLRVVDAAGQIVAEGRDIQRIWERLGVRSVPFRELPDPDWTRCGLVAWPVGLPGGELSASIQLSRGGIALPAFPTLIDRGNVVDLKLLDSRDESARRMRRGLRRLFALANRAAVEEQVAWLPGRLQWHESLAARVRPERLDGQLGDLIVDRAFLAGRPWPRTEEAFRERLRQGRDGLEAAVVDVVHGVAPLVEAYDALRRAFAGFSPDRPPDAARDVGVQLDRLLARDFLTETPWEWLQQFPRYFRAARERLERVGTHADRDREATKELERLWTRYDERRARDRARGRFDPELETYRWLLEEYRVSLFAQTIGTAVTISPRRLERQWERVVMGGRDSLAASASSPE